MSRLLAQSCWIGLQLLQKLLDGERLVRQRGKAVLPVIFDELLGIVLLHGFACLSLAEWFGIEREPEGNE